MSKRKYTDWHLDRARAAYLRTGSLAQAVEAAKGPSDTWVYTRLKAEGLIDDLVSYGSRTRRLMTERAVALYLDEEWPHSLREIQPVLKEEFGKSPSDQWIYERLKERGVIRSKSEANRIKNQKATGLKYSEMESAVRYLYHERKWSARKTADHLGLSRQTVTRWMKADGLFRDHHEACIVALWEAQTNVARKRRKEADLVARLRFEQKLTYHEIKAETGFSIGKIERALDVLRNGRPTYRYPQKSSPFRGVYYNRHWGRWNAELRVGDDRETRVGFASDRQAAEAYDEMCLERGLLDRLNFGASVMEAAA